MTRTRLLALAPDLSENSTVTAWQFRGALEAMGYDVTLAGPASAGPWAPLSEELGSAVRFGAPAVWPPLSGPDRLASDSTLVYAFKAHPSSFGLGLRLARRRDLPLVLHLDDWDAGFLRGGRRLRRAWWAARALSNPDGELWLRACEALIPRADALTVSTRALQRRFGGTVVRQGVDTDRFRPDRYPRSVARERLGLAADQPMVLFLGTPRRHKGIDLLLSLKELRSAVWIVGAGPRIVEELGLDDASLDGVTLLPPVSYEEAAWHMAACDVFVVPQEDTPFAAHQVPAKLLKAMALGLAVVTTDVGDASELLGGDPAAGMVVPPGSPAALREAISVLLGDPGAGAALGGEARRRAEAHHGWSAMGRTLDALVSRLVSGGRAPRGLDFPGGAS